MRKGRSKEFLDGTRRHGSYRLPLEKFFRSRLGQPWSKVHSEMSKEFDRRTYAGYKFWDMVDWEVAQNVWIGAATGTVYEDGSYGGSLAVDGFYVHPWTGILCCQKRVTGRKKEPEERTRIVIDDRQALEKMEGIWYYTEYVIDPYSGYQSAFYQRPSKDYNVTKKRQLSSKELAANKLVNTPMDWESQVCEVCHLLNNSNRIVKCIWCRICSAWLCEPCRKDWNRRLMAAEKKLLKKKQEEEFNQQHTMDIGIPTNSL